ncbi:MAG: ABC transporter ATP-binding protein, partial [Steroidobacteraceae bacterium]|nr:ABC transporter ATP-binding protein [Deltaproteobacteria bacterium]
MPTDKTTAPVFLPTAELLRRAPLVADFFSSLGLGLPAGEVTPADFFAALDADLLEDLGLERQSLAGRLLAFMELLEELKGATDGSRIESITIRDGHDKSGR